MATIIKTKNNKKIVLLNPNEKAQRYKRQNMFGVIKETGETLSPTDKAYRAGYVDAVNEKNRMHGYINATPAERKAYKKEQAQYRAERKKQQAYKKGKK